jgi:hypothetical protein
MEARFAAIRARPFGLGSDQANAGRIGVVVDLPLRGEEGLDIIRREKIRGAVRTVEDADLPAMGQGRLERRCQQLLLRRLRG